MRLKLKIRLRIDLSALFLLFEELVFSLWPHFIILLIKIEMDFFY